MAVYAAFWRHFNSRAHVERDTYYSAPPRDRMISTHALTWSATLRSTRHLSQTSFQLTRSRGARPHGRRGDRVESYFNSRAHVERDFIRRLSHVGTFYFNSRAHVERDLQCARSPSYKRDFNSRAHVERDLGYFCDSIQEEEISTHALTWSATGKRGSATAAKLNFNSRAHVERDISSTY